MLSSLALSIERRSQPHSVHSLQFSSTPLVSVAVLPAASSMSLGSIVKAAEPHCDEFAPSSPAQGRVRIVNSIDPAKNSTFLDRRGILRRGKTGPFLPSGSPSMKMSCLDSFRCLISPLVVCSGCDSVPNPVTRPCEKRPPCPAPVSYKSEACHPDLDDAACVITGNIRKRFRAPWRRSFSWCNDGDGQIFPASLVLKPSENPDDPGCPCAIGSIADVFLWSHGIAFVCPRTEIVNHGDWSLRTTSKIDGAVTRIRNPSPRNRAFQRTKFQRVIRSRS
jgi:hypothetical protein